MLLVTGASGYIGRAVLLELAQHGHAIRTTTRATSALPDESPFLRYDSDKPLQPRCLKAYRALFIARASRIATRQRTITNNSTSQRRSDSHKPLQAGVSQFVFVSSMNIVPADCSAPDAEAAEWPAPSDPYSASKWLAEQELKRVLSGTACDLTIVRPGLVYDQELTANLARLQGLLSRYPVGFLQWAAERWWVGLISRDFWR